MTAWEVSFFKLRLEHVCVCGGGGGRVGGYGGSELILNERSVTMFVGDWRQVIKLN